LKNYIKAYLQVIYSDGVREVLDFRKQKSEDWWLCCAWIRAPERVRDLCWIHVSYRLLNYPRFARDCCTFVNKKTCYCFYLTADTNAKLIMTDVKSASIVAAEGDGTFNNPFILWLSFCPWKWMIIKIKIHSQASVIICLVETEFPLNNACIMSSTQIKQSELTKIKLQKPNNVLTVIIFSASSPLLDEQFICAIFLNFKIKNNCNSTPINAYLDLTRLTL
jgi:hypothetical protein